MNYSIRIELLKKIKEESKDILSYCKDYIEKQKDGTEPEIPERMERLKNAFLILTDMCPESKFDIEYAKNMPDFYCLSCSESAIILEIAAYAHYLANLSALKLGSPNYNSVEAAQCALEGLK